MVTLTKTGKRRIVTSGALVSLLMNPLFVAPVVALAALLIKPKRPAAQRALSAAGCLPAGRRSSSTVPSQSGTSAR